MLDPEVRQQFDTLNAKVDATFQSAEKTRKYIFWTGIITAAVIIIPLLFLPFAVNSLLSTYSTALNF